MTGSTSRRQRSTASVAALLMLFATLSIFCAAAVQATPMPPCCKGHCARAAVASPLTAVAPAPRVIATNVAAVAVLPQSCQRVCTAEAPARVASSGAPVPLRI